MAFHAGRGPALVSERSGQSMAQSQNTKVSPIAIIIGMFAVGILGHLAGIL